MARPSWPTLVARRCRVNATLIVPSKLNFLDYHAGPSVFPDAKLIRRRQTARPDYAPAAFQHRPAGTVPSRDTSRQEHLLEFLQPTAALRPICVPGPPAPQNQRLAEQIGVKNRAISFSVAL